MRQPLRSQIGEELTNKGAEFYRTQQAKKRMKPGDSEPPTLPSTSVLRVAKAEYVKSTYIHPDPHKSLEIMKCTTWSNSIHSIGYNPVFVHFWTAHQIRLYLNYSLKENASVAFDATGGIINSIELLDGEKSGPIYVYSLVVNCKLVDSL